MVPVFYNSLALITACIHNARIEVEKHGMMRDLTAIFFHVQVDVMPASCN